MSNKHNDTVTQQRRRHQPSDRAGNGSGRLPNGIYNFDCAGLAGVENGKALVAAVLTLPEPELSIVAMLHRVPDALSYEQLAENLNCRPQDARELHRHALRMLQHVLDATAALQH